MKLPDFTKFDLDDYVPEEAQMVFCVIVIVLGIVIGVPMGLIEGLWPVFGCSVWAAALAIWRIRVIIS